MNKLRKLRGQVQFKRLFTSKSHQTWSIEHPLYRHKEVDQNVFFIQEKYFEFSWNLANIFFIRGQDRDLLIDTGVGIHSLPAFLKSSGLRTELEKPLDVVLTHLHFDHSGGAHQFQQVNIHSLEAYYLQHGDKFMTASWITPEEVVPKPKGWKAQDYNTKPANINCIQGGHTFHLGDRMFEVLHIPGHSPGSIALHDADNGVLATGDTIYQTSHGLIDWYPGSNSTKMLNSVKLLLELAKDKTVNTVLTGHNDVIDSAVMVKQGEQYVAEHGWRRKILKGLSRGRANLVLKGNSIMRLPEVFRESISN